MSLNTYQDALERAECDFKKAMSASEEAFRLTFGKMAAFHEAERKCLSEMVCKWCHANPCTCPKVTTPRRPR